MENLTQTKVAVNGRVKATNTNEDSIRICGRKFKKRSNDEYINYFKNQNQVDDWYIKMNKLPYITKNFGGSPYQNMSFTKLKINEKKIHISPPRAKNGDNNWCSYSNNFGFYVIIQDQTNLN